MNEKILWKVIGILIILSSLASVVLTKGDSLKYLVITLPLGAWFMLDDDKYYEEDEEL